MPKSSGSENKGMGVSKRISIAVLTAITIAVVAQVPSAFSERAIALNDIDTLKTIKADKAALSAVDKKVDQNITVLHKIQESQKVLESNQVAMKVTQDSSLIEQRAYQKRADEKFDDITEAQHETNALLRRLLAQEARHDSTQP